ncbi:MAG: hypothetical protein VX498_00495, partial [Myxococcota bacterium]|nr:hypothetical protein [Myxococcota bacterium]
DDKGQETPEPPPDGDKGQETPAPPADDDDAGSATPRDYSREYLASINATAASGGLAADEVSHLKACPPSNSNYERAMALLVAHYERKRDYKNHCSVATTVLGSSRYKYNPSWNLEGAKCALRNGQLSKAISLADNTISYQGDMAGGNKGRRIVLAYQTKAKARTKQYDIDAKANAGFGNEQLLNKAIAAWEDVRNYAQGIGHSSAASSANREIEDLEARRAPKE